MKRKECMAVILAGGRGERLGALTKYSSKPAVPFGGSHRIIDFTLSNCSHSEIDTICVLSQHFSTGLHYYIDSIRNLDMENGCRVIMRPSSRGMSPYSGTANAVFQNIAFIDRINPEHVLVLAGDHIYKMDYRKMLAFHEDTNADVTVASTYVPIKQASRYGILNVNQSGRISEFEEKPLCAKSNLASMGIYVFKWSVLRQYLSEDNINKFSQHDFGRNIIPFMLASSENVYAYEYNGYWKDVGTVDSLWESNMDLIQMPPKFNINDDKWEIFCSRNSALPSYTSRRTVIKQSSISGGCSIFGRVERSILSDSVIVREGAEIIDSVIMPNAYIGKNTKIYKTIVGSQAKIMDNVKIGTDYGISSFVDQISTNNVSLIGPGVLITEGLRLQKGSHIVEEGLYSWDVGRNMLQFQTGN